jgi:hypothetical protein
MKADITKVEIILKILALTIVAAVICIILYVVGALVYSYFMPVWYPARIERITDIRVPKFEVTKYVEGRRSFTGDYKDTYFIDFKTTPSEELFDEIDRKIAKGGTEWKRDGKQYSFSVFWGNGFAAPEGESEDADGFFDITLIRGEKEAIIHSGAW